MAETGGLAMGAGDAMSVREGGRRRRQLPEEVAAYVRELIVSGAARPGEFLRVEPIAEAVGVSNTPVREGLLALRSEGFVRLVPRRGFVVAPFTRRDVRDLFWAQAQLAGELAARAARRPTREQIAQMETLLLAMDRAIEDGRKDLIADLGHAFHREINLAATSPRLALLLGAVAKHLPRSFYATVEGQVEGSREAHPRLLEALRRHRSGEARRLMEAHILEASDHLIAVLEERGLWDEAESAAPVPGAPE